MVRTRMTSLAHWLVVLVAATSVAAANPEAAVSVVGGNYVLTAGETLTADLTAIGARVTLEPGSRLDGHLTTIGGAATIAGTVSEDVHAYGGELVLAAGARVDGDVGTRWAAFDPHPGAVVGGELDLGARRAVTFDLPAVPIAAVDVFTRGAPADRVADTLARGLGLALFAALLVLAVPTQVDRVRRAMIEQTRRAVGTGLAGIGIAVLALVLTVLTIVGIPIAVVGALLVALVVVLGWVALGVHVGRVLEGWLGQRWAPWQSAAAGAFAVVLALQVLDALPVVGGIANLVLSAVAVGALMLTRGGTRAAPQPAIGPAQPATRSA